MHVHHADRSHPTLAPHLADDQWVVVDCRFDLDAIRRKASSTISTRTSPARAMRISIAICRARRPARTDGIRCRLPSRCASGSARSASARGTQVVAYDADTGMYAARLWWMLRFMGHDAVAVLDGGLARWVARRPRRPRRPRGRHGRRRSSARRASRGGSTLTPCERPSGGSRLVARRRTRRTALPRRAASRSTRAPATFRAPATSSFSRT